MQRQERRLAYEGDDDADAEQQKGGRGNDVLILPRSPRSDNPPPAGPQPGQAEIQKQEIPGGREHVNGDAFFWG